MKKVLSFLILFAIVFSFAGCDSNTENDTLDSTVDYSDAASFESALNDGAKVKGKTVQFYVKEYVPDSILGINCHAGEHLNFLFEDELEVGSGDTIIVRISEEPSKVFLIGSWKIPCEFLEFSETAERPQNNTENEPTAINTPEASTEKQETKPSKITLTMGEDDFKGMNYKDAEKKFREMGFTKFKYKTVEAKNASSADTICYIEITEFIFPDSSLKKGDKFDADSTITFYTYEYKEPAKPSPVFYSTNDYATAQKGNTGVFSYKNKSGSYDVYWIIDFDDGYVYFFTEGNGDTSCDKVKIASGNLNDRIAATWHDGEDRWTWYLHFKYKNAPETLVIQDHNGFSTEFRTTDLYNALKIRNTKTIKEY